MKLAPCLFTWLAGACVVLGTGARAETYDARIADKEILTPPPPVAPRINGPALYGARPGRKFIYRIPTRGFTRS